MSAGAFYCEGKEAFPGRAAANKVARNMARFGKTVTTYRCSACRDWHVGRPKPHLSGR